MPRLPNPLRSEFGVIVIGAELPNSGTIAMVVVCTVTFSIVAHGVTANPWARAYGARARLGGPAAPGGDPTDA